MVFNSDLGEVNNPDKIENITTNSGFWILRTVENNFCVASSFSTFDRSLNSLVARDLVLEYFLKVIR